jgi:hypothetical protein
MLPRTFAQAEKDAPRFAGQPDHDVRINNRRAVDKTALRDLRLQQQRRALKQQIAIGSANTGEIKMKIGTQLANQMVKTTLPRQRGQSRRAGSYQAHSVWSIATACRFTVHSGRSIP